MAPLTKQSVPVNFAQGLDLKTDPYQVSLGRFLTLENSVFTTGGRLTKRNGFDLLTPLPDTTYAYLTTLNSNLTALGQNVAAYDASTAQWVVKGKLAPMEVSTLALLRNNFNQTQCDSAIAANGLICTVYTETDTTTTNFKYVIANSITGQNIVAPTLIPGGVRTVSGSAKVFVFGLYFVIVFPTQLGGSTNLDSLAIPIANPSAPITGPQIAAGCFVTSNPNWDGVVAANTLFIGYTTSSGGNRVNVAGMSSALNITNTLTYSVPRLATSMSLCSDTFVAAGSPYVYVIYAAPQAFASFHNVYAIVVNLIAGAVAPVSGPTIDPNFPSGSTVVNIASAAFDGAASVYFEVVTPYGFTTTPNDSIISTGVSQLGVWTLVNNDVVRGAGLASKAFTLAGEYYFLIAYESQFQPTYFLINASESSDNTPIIAAKLAYENGGGYLSLGLPSVTVTNDEVVQIPYLFKDLVEPLATANNTQQTTVPGSGVYSQTGINLATFDFTTNGTDAVEIASNLHISGGFLWQYDGYLPVEHNFFLWPELNPKEDTNGPPTPNGGWFWSVSGGHMDAKPDGDTNTDAYFYQATYEWTDNQGNAYRSAPSIPIAITTTGSGNTGSVALYIPTLRLTYKIANPVKICVYRWSVKNQIYYQVSGSATQPNPVLAPTLNDTQVDYVTFVDTWPDSAIVGNNILYTTGGVVEDINAPATNIITLFDTRLWLVDAEDKNLLWFSKQVIEATPVEMSDLFTFYVAPTTAAQGSTGVITALSPMDDKLIVFKQNAIYYINGTGPDNTGANNQYSQPIFITATVGCTNQQSIVFMPQGLMFQSDKGIWLLGRDLSTNYIGAPVEGFNGSLVKGAVNVPNTNQVRFTLDTGQTLMYDYYYGQWGTFVGVPAIASALYQGAHTCIDTFGRVLQETPGSYMDAGSPVLMSFTTSWLSLAGVQGFQRAYFFFILATYQSPHKMQLQVAYDYVSTPTQTTLITPDNFSVGFGDDPVFGSTPTFGGEAQLEQWRVFLQHQKCRTLQLTFNEVFDPTFSNIAGAGLTLSGLNFVIGAKKGYPAIRAARSAG